MFLLGRQRNAEAVNRISEAMRLDPVSPSTLTYGAYIFFLTNDYARSRQQVDRALALDPQFPFAFYVQGHLCAAAGKLAGAISAYQKAVVSSGRTPKYLYFLAQTYVKSGAEGPGRATPGRTAEAVRDRLRAPGIHPEAFRSFALTSSPKRSSNPRPVFSERKAAAGPSARPSARATSGVVGSGWTSLPAARPRPDNPARRANSRLPEARSAPFRGPARAKRHRVGICPRRPR